MNTLIVVGVLFLTSPDGVVMTATQRFPTMEACKTETLKVIQYAAAVQPDHLVEASCEYIESGKDA